MIGVRWKHLTFLLTVQAGCCAMGVWWHGHLAISLINRATIEQGWRYLASQAKAQSTKDKDTVPLSTISVDRNWRVRDGANNHSPPRGTLLSWTSSDAAPRADFRYGVIEFDGVKHVALARPSDAGGYTVLHLPLDSIATPPGALAYSVQAAGAITVLWVSPLMGLAIYLISTRMYEKQARAQSRLESRALDQVETLQRMRDGIVFGLAKLAEFRDDDTGSHLERISAFATRLASALRRRPGTPTIITRDFVRMMGISAVLHDIGKVGIPDAILLKPGPLTPDERLIMNQHTLIGAQCIAEIERRLGNSNYLRMAGEIALSHHERWDGSGYPHGLGGEEIPLAARIVAIVDVYDALSSRRVDKEPLSHDDCVEVIRNESGRHFDPMLVEAFLEIERDMRDIARKYSSEVLPLSPPPAPLPRWNLAREYEELVTSGAVQDDGLWLVDSNDVSDSR